MNSIRLPNYVSTSQEKLGRNEIQFAYPPLLSVIRIHEHMFETLHPFFSPDSFIYRLSQFHTGSLSFCLYFYTINVSQPVMGHYKPTVNVNFRKKVP